MNRTITITMNPQVYEGLKGFMEIREVTGNNIGPDYDFCSAVIKAIEAGKKEIKIFVGKR